MAEWIDAKEITKGKTVPVVVRAEKMKNLLVETPDEGGKLGKAIEDNLMRLCPNETSTDQFALPKLTLNDQTVPDNAGGMHGIGTGEITQGSPHIQLPPSQSGTIYVRPKDYMGPKDKTLRMVLTLEQAAIFLHEVNHAIHRFVNNGKYMHPKSSVIVGAIEQDIHRGIMDRALQTDFDYRKAMIDKKANEMETYWLCCCDAAKYQMDESAVTAIKAANNINLFGAGYENVVNQNQEDVINRNVNNPKFMANVVDINNIDPRYNTLTEQDDLSQFETDKGL